HRSNHLVLSIQDHYAEKHLPFGDKLIAERNMLFTYGQTPVKGGFIFAVVSENHKLHDSFSL
ncbi:MAG: hypothetical protein ACREN8_05185, partial [Candidatus Dormibacteraceae bacterium]